MRVIDHCIGGRAGFEPARYGGGVCGSDGGVARVRGEPDTAADPDPDVAGKGGNVFVRVTIGRAI